MDGTVRLTRIGATVRDEWERTSTLRPEVRLDAFVVMPNHVHAVAIIADGAVLLEELLGESHFDMDGEGKGCVSPHRTVGSIVRGFKGAVTSRVRKRLGDDAFVVWQAGLYEHVIRDMEDLVRIREYIEENPARWLEDPYHPNKPGKRDSR